MQKNINTSNISIKNRRASFEFELLERYTAGIVLMGSEIKSIRLGRASIAEGYCFIDHGELIIKNMYVAEYLYANNQIHGESRDKKLLVKKKELNRLMRISEKGLTIIPLHLFINAKGLAKLEVALAKGKKLHDKRQSEREHTIERKIRQELKDR